MWINPNTSITTENYIILPSQFLERAKVDRPEHRLLLALLTDAWNVLDMYSGLDSRRGNHLTAEVWEWMEAGDVGAFTFDQTCEHLGFNPETFRKGVIAALKERGVSTLQAGVRRTDVHRTSMRVSV